MQLLISYEFYIYKYQFFWFFIFQINLINTKNFILFFHFDIKSDKHINTIDPLN